VKVAIVGGGPAGTTTALSLVAEAPELAGQIVLFEKARFPRDKPCAGAIGGRGDALLEAMGVVVDVPSVVIDGVSVRTREADVTVAPGRVGRVVRRIEFDHALARAAAARGILLRDGVAVEAIEDDGAAVHLETAAGAFKADVVVGCDGVGSLVRRSLGVSPGLLRAQVIEVDTPPVASDRARNVIHFDAFDRTLPGYIWDFPTLVAGEPLVCRGVYWVKTGERAGPDLSSILDRRLAALGAEGAGRRKRYAERGFERATRYAAGRCMLVGEAAGIDALTGEGIAQAIECGVLAGRYLARKLRGRARPPFDVTDWHDELHRSRLARDLARRASILGLYHGPWRDEIERFFAACPLALDVGALHFAARPIPWPDVAEVVARGLAHGMASGIRVALER
jgi:flavin-dependent dehydrogenase